LYIIIPAKVKIISNQQVDAKWDTWKEVKMALSDQRQLLIPLNDN